MRINNLFFHVEMKQWACTCDYLPSWDCEYVRVNGVLKSGYYSVTCKHSFIVKSPVSHQYALTLIPLTDWNRALLSQDGSLSLQKKVFSSLLSIMHISNLCPDFSLFSILSELLHELYKNTGFLMCCCK